MRIYETQLPGIGVRYTVQFPEKGELIILTQNDGSREVFWRERPTADSDSLFELDEDESKKLSDIFDGTYFQPVEDGLEDILENARIKWIHVDAASPVADRTIGEVSIRSTTGVTILAIRRGDTVLSEIDPSTRIQAGDVLVGVGTDESHRALQSLLD
ncbi:cation:proton antiporter regulatory subunit [Haloarchaeobius sp. TZWWS8]|uniref:cation:proton antiporter regulatory subunit n=1 Tax=Haloarchaeobius sp. TZWWS8 TaxID=3446121 RepID=UPI003EBD3F6C